MRAQTVAMVARVHNNRVVSQATSFKAGEDGANALIHQRNKPEIALLDTSIFLGSDPEKQLHGQSLPIKDCFGLLPFAHQAIAQWNIFTLRKCGGRVKVHLIERMLTIERPVVGRVRFYKTNNEDKRIAAMFFDKLACMPLKKLWPREFNRQIANG